MADPAPRGRLVRVARTALVTVLSASLALGRPGGPASAAGKPRPLTPAQVSKGLTGEVYGFLPYWEIDGGIDAYLRYDLLTTIGLFAIYFDGAGGVNGGTLTGGGRGAVIDTVVQHAHAAGVRVELTLRPGNDSASGNDAFFHNATAQATAISNSVAAVGQFGADGVNVDIEVLQNDDFAAYGAFVGSLGASLRASNAAARVTVSTNGNTSGAALARQAIDHGADRVFLMGYGYRSSGSSPAGVISPIERFSGGTLDLLGSLDTYAAYGVPVGRLVLGLPYYGMSWPTSSGGLHASTTGGGSAWFPDTGLPAMPPGTIVQRDTLEAAAWFAVQDPTTKAWRQTYFDDGASLRNKYALAVGRGLVGVGMWALGYDRGQPGYWEAVAATFGVLRLAGSDRYGTAQALSVNLFQPAIDTVVVATGETFPDALGGSAAAGHLKGPLLLTYRLSLANATRAELKRLAPANVLVLGGNGAISDPVFNAIKATVPAASVTRVSGSDRYGTAAALSALVYPTGAPVAFVANGFSFPDGLAGGAQGARLGGPVLLTSPVTFPSATSAELTRLNPGQVFVLGGKGAVSDAVLAEVAAAVPAATVTRLAGADRYATSVAISSLQAPGVPVVYLSTGSSFPDGLAGGAAAGQLGGPLLLTYPWGLPSSVAAELGRLKPRRVVVLGGTNVISNTVVAQVRAYLASP